MPSASDLLEMIDDPHFNSTDFITRARAELTGDALAAAEDLNDCLNPPRESHPLPFTHFFILTLILLSQHECCLGLLYPSLL